jgi:hypothetical protein
MPPHVLMDRILRHEQSFNDSVLPATDEVLFEFVMKASSRKKHSLKGGSLTEPASYRDGRKSKKG